MEFVGLTATAMVMLVIGKFLQYLQKTFNCNDRTITEFGIIDNKNSSTAYVILNDLIDTWFLDSNRRVGVWSLPWRWHILSIPLTTCRGTSAETSGFDDVFPPDDIGSSPEALVNIYVYIHVYIYIYMYSLYDFLGRIYTYNGSVIQYWRSCTPSRSIWLYSCGVCGSWAEWHFLFSLVYQLCLAL